MIFVRSTSTKYATSDKRHNMSPVLDHHYRLGNQRSYHGKPYDDRRKTRYAESGQNDTSVDRSQMNVHDCSFHRKRGSGAHHTSNWKKRSRPDWNASGFDQKKWIARLDDELWDGPKMNANQNGQGYQSRETNRRNSSRRDYGIREYYQ